jgi:NAD(P)-dependent dehydrogenase (short-subunit alcohol dehydrogenase family)
MKTILITGAANGLGRQLLTLAAAAGHDVIGLDRVELQDPPAAVRFIRCDLRNITEVCANREPLDVLINNAAIGSVAPLEHQEPEWIADCISVNLTAPLVLIREALPHMRKRGGRIINISSLSGVASVPGTTVYAAAKAGLERSSKILKAELRGSGVSIGLVRLGRMRTESYLNAGRLLQERLAARSYPGYEKIENVLWGVVGNTNVGIDPREAARQILEFVWTTRYGITIAPPGERIQASFANLLPPSMINGLLGLFGRLARPT